MSSTLIDNLWKLVEKWEQDCSDVKCAQLSCADELRHVISDAESRTAAATLSRLGFTSPNEDQQLKNISDGADSLTKNNNWFESVFGKWPGDETDEEITAALKDQKKTSGNIKLEHLLSDLEQLVKTMKQARLEQPDPDEPAFSLGQHEIYHYASYCWAIDIINLIKKYK